MENHHEYIHTHIHIYVCYPDFFGAHFHSWISSDSRRWCLGVRHRPHTNHPQHLRQGLPGSPGPWSCLPCPAFLCLGPGLGAVGLDVVRPPEHHGDGLRVPPVILPLLRRNEAVHHHLGRLDGRQSPPGPRA
jgi:hypothetical protein